MSTSKKRVKSPRRKQPATPDMIDQANVDTDPAKGISIPRLEIHRLPGHCAASAHLRPGQVQPRDECVAYSRVAEGAPRKRECAGPGGRVIEGSHRLLPMGAPLKKEELREMALFKKDVIITARITHDIKETIQSLADGDERPLGWVVRRLILEALEARSLSETGEQHPRSTTVRKDMIKEETALYQWASGAGFEGSQGTNLYSLLKNSRLVSKMAISAKADIRRRLRTLDSRLHGNDEKNPEALFQQPVYCSHCY